MPALNFQKRFVTLIRSGEKCQTIRAVRKDGRPPCRHGDRLKLYTGMRTKGCRLVKTVEVIDCEKITIRHDGAYLADAVYGPDGESPDFFARLDGFTDWTEMRDWFAQAHGLPFEGWLIRWKPI